MKDTTTQINSELLSADARGRKHIPVAVFAVILIHVILFVVLLIAAGCRSSARAKRVAPQAEPQVAEQQAPALPAALLAAATTLSNTAQASAESMAEKPLQNAVLSDPVSEPAPEEPRAVANTIVERPAPQKPISARSRGSSARPVTRSAINLSPKVYVVKSGDTLEKIARRHGVTIQAVKTANKMKGDMIYAGQKLQITPGGSEPLQVRSEKQKQSKEA